MLEFFGIHRLELETEGAFAGDILLAPRAPAGPGVSSAPLRMAPGPRAGLALHYAPQDIQHRGGHRKRYKHRGANRTRHDTSTIVDRPSMCCHELRQHVRNPQVKVDNHDKPRMRMQRCALVHERMGVHQHAPLPPLPPAG